ncbi:DUF3108 domain-containing protein [Paraburkholderia sp. DGU8]|uniref:DUF3108 domain-containing protein n=1 Tax=Paraburkholderia sp. DGU8 TaxID=3161997 RepID=UPI0034650DBB
MDTATAARRSNRPPSNGPRDGSRAWRWLAVLAAVAVMHWLAAQWFEHTQVTLKPADHERMPVQVALLRPERIETKPAAAPPKPAPARVRKPVASPPREHVLTALQPATQAAPPAAAASGPAASEPAAAPGSGANAAASAASTAATSAPVAASAPQASNGVKFSVPPSGELQYDTFFNGVRNAPGTIHWSSNGQSYEMIVSVPVPFVGPFVYSSHGRIDAFGLAPDEYVEKRGRRAEDIAIFNRNEKKIAFTRTPAALPLQDGAQDRFSMVMQLASLVRGEPAAYEPGVVRQFFVVDNDSGENWPVEAIGDETIRTTQGYLDTRHFKRLPRHEGDMRRIDVWLAPSLGWLPARIVQTEPNGTQVELLWHGKLAIDTAGLADGNGATAASPSPSPAAPDNSAEPPPADTSATAPGAAPVSPVDSTWPGIIKP